MRAVRNTNQLGVDKGLAIDVSDRKRGSGGGRARGEEGGKVCLFARNISKAYHLGYEQELGNGISDIAGERSMHQTGALHDHLGNDKGLAIGVSDGEGGLGQAQQHDEGWVHAQGLCDARMQHWHVAQHLHAQLWAMLCQDALLLLHCCPPTPSLPADY